MRYAAEEWVGARHILYVPGNHEFHGADIDRARKQLAEERARHGITLLNNVELSNLFVDLGLQSGITFTLVRSPIAIQCMGNSFSKDSKTHESKHD